MDQILFQQTLHGDLPGVARKILSEFHGERVFAFYGNLGAGKTALIKALCSELNVTDEVTSPSFALVNEYHCSSEELIYHFDFYRIKKLEEVLDIGYEEYLYSGWYCFLEWADKMEELLPDSFVKITIVKNEGDDARRIHALKVG
jgi:tRNA threonylcarbamoyladenosine biosynthesis protein TsaE